MSNPYRGMKIKADIKLSLSDQLLISGTPFDKVLLFFVSLAKGIGVILLFLAAITLFFGILIAVVYGLYLLCAYNPVFILSPLAFWFLYGLSKQVTDHAKDNLDRKLAPKINENE